MFIIDNKYKNANIARTVRFTEEMFNKLQKTASENDISFNSLILQCCAFALGNMEDKNT